MRTGALTGPFRGMTHTFYIKTHVGRPVPVMRHLSKMCVLEREGAGPGRYRRPYRPPRGQLACGRKSGEWRLRIFGFLVRLLFVAKLQFVAGVLVMGHPGCPARQVPTKTCDCPVLSLACASRCIVGAVRVSMTSPGLSWVHSPRLFLPSPGPAWACLGSGRFCYLKRKIEKRSYTLLFDSAR